MGGAIMRPPRRFRKNDGATAEQQDPVDRLTNCQQFRDISVQVQFVSGAAALRGGGWPTVPCSAMDQEAPRRGHDFPGGRILPINCSPFFICVFSVPDNFKQPDGLHALIRGPRIRTFSGAPALVPGIIHFRHGSTCNNRSAGPGTPAQERMLVAISCGQDSLRGGSLSGRICVRWAAKRAEPGWFCHLVCPRR